MRSLALLVALLVPVAAGAQGVLVPTAPGVPFLPIRAERIDVEVKDGVAVTRIEQRFANPTGRPLEAHFCFPVPDGASVDGFALWVNGERVAGELLERGKATAIYEEIVRRTRDPGLLEHLGDGLFRARIFPVPAHGEQRVEIRTTAVLPSDGGVLALRHPLRRPGAPPERLVFEARIASRAALKAIWSPTHELEIRRDGERRATVTFEPSGREGASRDLELFVGVADGDVGVSVLAHREPGEPGYFLALVTPRHEWQDEETGAKRVTFVVDTSGSMAGEKLRHAREVLRRTLAGLRPTDRFEIVRFSSGVEPLFGAPREASPANLRRARRFVEGFAAAGGTALDEALRRGIAAGEEGDGPHLLVLVTDGAPTVGETDPARIVAAVKRRLPGRTRIFPFGVGVDLNAKLLDALAAEGRGVAEYARDGADLERRLAAFWDKVSHPVLTDLTLALDGAEAFDLLPRSLPDLFRGGQLAIVGRYREPGTARVTVAGRIDGEPRSFSTRVRLPARGGADFLPRLWATRKVGFLLDEIRRNGERAELRDEVIALARRHGLVTPYTSYLVVEDEPVRPLPHPRPPIGGGFRGRDADPTPRRKNAGPAAAPDLRAESGAPAIAASEAVRELKEAEVLADEVSRTASGRTFVRRDGAWRDTAVGERDRVLRIRYLSPAHLALLEVRPDLREAAALGDRVMIGVGPGRAVEIAPERGTASPEEVRAFLGGGR